MRDNLALPTTKAGNFIAPHSAQHIPNYQAIDSMVSFGTKKASNMEETWLEAVATATDTKTGNMDLRTTMEMVRGDVRFKRSRL